MTVHGSKNHLLFSNIANRARDSAHERKWNTFIVNERLYIHLHYRDLIDRQHDDYYEVPMVGGGRRLQDPHGIEVFQRWRWPMIELGNLSAEDLFSEATNRVK
jgi:hypothetical protein